MSVVVNVYDGGSKPQAKQSKVAKAPNKKQSQVKQSVPVKASAPKRKKRKWYQF